MQGNLPPSKNVETSFIPLYQFKALNINIILYLNETYSSLISLFVASDRIMLPRASLANILVTI